jgi:hypothetical protein
MAPDILLYFSQGFVLEFNPSMTLGFKFQVLLKTMKFLGAFAKIAKSDC